MEDDEFNDRRKDMGVAFGVDWDGVGVSVGSSNSNKSSSSSPPLASFSSQGWRTFLFQRRSRALPRWVVRASVAVEDDWCIMLFVEGKAPFVGAV